VVPEALKPLPNPPDRPGVSDEAEALVEHRVVSRAINATKDDGKQPVRWIGTCKMSKIDLDVDANLRPFRFKEAALVQNMLKRNLTVAPQN